jgi:TRAP-type mannitol/chloroaromatic compound transport system substrate-binding protein
MKLLLAFFTTLLFATTIYAGKNVEWKLAMQWNSTSTVISSPSFKMAQMVNELSDGRFIIKVNGKEKHDSKKSIFELIQNDNYQIGHTNSSNWKDIDINTLWFTGVPFGMTTKEQYAWFYYGGGKEYMSKVYDQYNLLTFPAGDLGTLMGGWYKKEINTISDLQGLKINKDGITSEILSMYGVTLKNIPLSKTVDSFKKGDLDVIIGSSPSIDIKRGFHKVAPFYYTAWDKPASQMQFLVNKQAFNELSKQYQTILTIAMKTAAYDLYYKNFYLSSKAWEKIQKDYPKIQVKSFPTNVIEKMKKTTSLIFEHYSKENKLFKEIYENQKQFQKKVRDWSIQEEFSYLKITSSPK